MDFKIKRTKIQTAAKKEKVVNLASTITETNRASTKYVCRECGDDLILDASYEVRNPYAGGRGYFCGTCQQTFDSSLVRLVKKAKPVTSTIGDVKSHTSVGSLIRFVPENKDFLVEDEYKNYDDMFDPNADQLLLNQGATIIDSRIEITDSMGRNRTLLRRL